MDKEFFIVIDSEKVPVSEEVYRSFKRPAWAERKRRHTRADRERSLEVFMDEGFDIPSNDPLVDEIVEDKLMLDMLFAALAELTDNERGLIDALFYQDKSERDVAREMSVSQNTVNYHKNRLLDKLRNLLEKKF